ncbi:MAG TPA: hypothetical protein VJY33_07265 [Isosphaeraceae bacterium]|nr:hypothetical protein [Isosphaeraceae bacterium]
MATNRLGLHLAAAFFGLLLSLPLRTAAMAHEPPGPTPDVRPLAEIKATYERERREIDRREIADLSALASRMSGPGADAVYCDLFHLAIGRDLCADARRGADNCLASATTSDEARGLALLVRMIALADSGQENEAMAQAAILLGGERKR